MGELIKLLVDLLTLKDASNKGKFSWLTMAVGFAAVAVVGVVAVFVITYYDRHPEAGPAALFGMLAFAVVILGVTVFWGWRYQNRLAASRKPAA